jgi:hypothetical protein
MTTNNVAAFNAAYAAAQAECENPSLDSINPAFRSKFSSLAATRNAVIPVFAKHGIAIQQTPMTEMIGDRLFAGVRTVLRHKDGHVEDLGACPMPVMKADPQGIASCLTYSKRQSLQAIAGVTGETDDDANAASQPSSWGADPRGDLGKKVDTKLLNKWVKALIEQQDQPHRLADLWGEIKEDHDLAVAVWAGIPKPLKDRIKDAQEAA